MSPKTVAVIICDRDEANAVINAAGQLGGQWLRDQVLLRLIYRHGLRARFGRAVGPVSPQGLGSALSRANNLRRSERGLLICPLPPASHNIFVGDGYADLP